MKRLLEDGLGLVDLELCFEIGNMRKAATVGAAAGIGEGELLASDIIVDSSPVASTRAVLLHLLGVDIGKAVLTKEARDSLRREHSPLGNALVVTIVGLVRSGHFCWMERVQC